MRVRIGEYEGEKLAHVVKFNPNYNEDVRYFHKCPICEVEFEEGTDCCQKCDEVKDED